ncbi:MAG TPA: Ig-like domain-containing protein [Longimicrobium sp.]|nr:Ig-like domain-containing protein [Longimicrobium sp.]
MKLRHFVALYAAAALVVLLTMGGGCAHVEAPPGGEPDSAAPVLETTRPDTFATMRSYLGPVVFSFNEGLSEKGIDTVVTVSPRTSSIAVDKSGHQVRVELRRGWEPNRVYKVTLHPGVQDLFGNATREPITVVFSTGPEIVRTLASGTVIERTTLQPARGARVEALHQPDSTRYETRPDSTGRWVLEYLPEGTYRVRAYNDTNRDQQLQPYEAQDTTTITVTRGDTARARRLALIAPDTTAPKAGTASGEGDVVEIRFDDFLDPAQPLSAANVAITGAGGAAVRVAEVRVGPFPQAADSAGADTARGAQRDTGRAGRAAQRDTGRARQAAARLGEPLPSQSLFVRTAQPLAPDAQYTAVVTGVRNLVGLAGGGTVQLRTARAAPAPAARDTAVRDTVRSRAPANRPPPQPPAPQAPRPQTSPAPVAQPPRPRR